MNKICTSIEQSKKLIELGIDVDTSDMVYLRSYFEDEGEYNLLVGSYHEGYMEKDDGTLIPVFDEHIPAWSLTALLKLIPNFNMFKRTIECRIETTNHLIDKACEPIDAAFEMIVWLKENGKI